MKKYISHLLLSLFVLIIFTGCASVLPSEDKKTQMPWKTYQEAENAFSKIQPSITTVNDLKNIGYDPSVISNIKLLTYLDLIRIFMPNANITLDGLHPEVKKCIQSKDACKAYELDIEITDKNRFGNVAADIFGFRKNTKITGWKFRALILIRDNMVVYKLSSGQPSINVIEKEKHPLGPFQELDKLLGNTVKSAAKF